MFVQSEEGRYIKNMDTSAGDVEGEGGEDPPAAAGRKKGRFKQLKSRLFGRLRRKETEGNIKQSKSASDVTSDVTAQVAIGDYDSEDDCLDDSNTLGSRALSHDSIFQTDQSPSSPEPTRVLSQENVHGKIRALQQKLQLQNIRLGPPPLLISPKRMGDSGATSEDDGLPQSPPDTSFHDRPGHGYPYKFPDSHRNRSCLSLAGTGSEEEEQCSSQQSSRPLSPGSPTIFSGPLSPTEAGLSQVLDLTTPAQYTPSLDTSAARHRMSVKPRNQRASRKTRKGPPVHSISLSSSRPRPDSQSDLDQALSEEEDEEEEQERTDDKKERTREGSVEKLAGHPLDPVPSSGDVLPPLPEDQDLKPWFPAPPVGEEEVLPPLASTEPEGRVINNPLFLKALPLEPITLVPLSPTMPTEAVEGLQRAPKPGPNKPPIHPGPGPFTSDIHKDPGDLTALTLTVAVNQGVGAAERCPARPSPPAPVASESLFTRTPACVTGIPRAQPPGDPETTAPPVGEEDKLHGGESAGQKEERRSGSSHRFSISSARHRPKNRGSVQPEDGKKDDQEKERNGEGGKEGGEGKVGSTPKGCKGRPVVQPEARQIEVGRKTENQRDGPVEKEKNQRDGPVEKEKQGERKRAFGVKLRLTSQSLKYRSEVSQSDCCKRHSYEFLSNGKGPEPIRGELEDKAGSKVRVTSSQAPPQQTDISLVSTGKELDPKPKKKTGSTKPFASRVSDSTAGLPVSSPTEPAWMSMAREKSRSLQQQITSRPPSTEISLDMALHSGGEILPDQPNLQPPPGFLPQGSPSPTTIYSSVPSRTEMAPAGNKALLDKGQTEMATSRPVVSSSAPSSSPTSASTVEPCLTPRSQPSWLELAKRKSKAWCDKTMD